MGNVARNKSRFEQESKVDPWKIGPERSVFSVEERRKFRRWERLFEKFFRCEAAHEDGFNEQPSVKQKWEFAKKLYTKIGGYKAERASRHIFQSDCARRRLFYFPIGEVIPTDAVSAAHASLFGLYGHTNAAGTTTWTVDRSQDATTFDSDQGGQMNCMTTAMLSSKIDYISNSLVHMIKLLILTFYLLRKFKPFQAYLRSMKFCILQ